MAGKYAEILDDVCDPLTVRKFSEKCSISRQEAIKVLEKEVKSKGEPLWALYEVSGLVGSSNYSFLPRDEKMIKHVVVPASELEEAKKTFDEVISTCLHSVQRTNPKETRVYGRGWARNDDLKGKPVPGQQKAARKVEETATEVPEKVVKKEKSPAPEPEPKKKKQTNVMSMFAKKPAQNAEKKQKSLSPPPQKARKRPKVEIDEPEEADDSPPSSREVSVEKVAEKPEKATKKSRILESDDDDDQFPSSREQTPEKQEPPPPKRHKSGVNDENRKKVEVKKMTTGPSRVVKKEEDSDGEGGGKMEERRRTTRIEKVTETYVDEDGYLVSRDVSKAVECSPEKPHEKPKPLPKVITAPIPGAPKAVKKNAMITSFFKKQ